jgi:MauM/NapG family ferredoxin protein
VAAGPTHADAVLNLNRREFFRGGLRKLQEAVIGGIDAHVTAQAEHWVRPPYALSEMDFLLACNRCGDCIAACPHGTVFSLPLSCGIKAATTPALDLLHNACRLCRDWPCVRSCKAGALRLPESEDEEGFPLPVIAVARIDTHRCLPYAGPECSVCREACPVPGAMLWDRGKPDIDASHCVGCALCREACIVETKAFDIRSKHQAA